MIGPQDAAVPVAFGIAVAVFQSGGIIFITAEGLFFGARIELYAGGLLVMYPIFRISFP